MFTYVLIAIGVLVCLAVLAGLFMSFWRVAEPNKALVISGLHQKGARNSDGSEGESLGFKIVTGRGTMVLPGIQRVRELDLGLHETNLDEECVTVQGIKVHVKGVVVYKVGDDHNSMANAARRFLDQQPQMDDRVSRLFAGHLRAIVGAMQIEKLITDREALATTVREHCSTEMNKLGLVVDTMQLLEITDSVGYIEALSQPHIAEVQKNARIAKATADQDATKQEQEAQANKAQYQRDTQIKQAQFAAETERAQATAAQAGPLAEAQAKQGVVVEETKVAELNAQKKAKELETEVTKPADAEAYKTRVTAQAARDAQIARAEADAKQTELRANADATQTRVLADANAHQQQVTGEADGAAAKARGEGEAAAIRARGEAEGAAILARSDALAKNSDAVIAQQVAEKLPEIVEAAAKPFGNIDNLVVTNGAEGMQQMVMAAIAQGANVMQVVDALIKASRGAAAPEAPERKES